MNAVTSAGRVVAPGSMVDTHSHILTSLSALGLVKKSNDSD